jgi:hypothetical protein
VSGTVLRQSCKFVCESAAEGNEFLNGQHGNDVPERARRAF